MIPRIIHYCWFGKNPLDDRSRKCIESWKRFFPGYEIKCWNEDNFDVNQIPFMKEAYEAKKWAFVSDVARLLIIYQNGGIYFDTDVEVIRSYEDILKFSPKGFLGFEVTNYVATGLGFAAEKNNLFLLEVLEIYKEIHFSDYLDSLEMIACPIIMTKMMEKQGYIVDNRFQSFRGFNVYPMDFFSPLDYDTGKLKTTHNTHSIHWANASWNDDNVRKMRTRMQWFNRVFGKKWGDKVFGIYSCIEKEGLINYVRRHF